MSDNKALALMVAAVWSSVAVAVSVGIPVTGSGGCLWAFLLPACMSFTGNRDEDKEEGEEGVE